MYFCVHKPETNLPLKMKRFFKAYKIMVSNTAISIVGFVSIAFKVTHNSGGDMAGFLLIAIFGVTHIATVLSVGIFRKNINLELLSHLALLTMLQLISWAFFSENITNALISLGL